MGEGFRRGWTIRRLGRTMMGRNRRSGEGIFVDVGPYMPERRLGMLYAVVGLDAGCGVEEGIFGCGIGGGEM